MTEKTIGEAMKEFAEEIKKTPKIGRDLMILAGIMDEDGNLTAGYLTPDTDTNHCTHKEIEFASGDYYLICNDCKVYWRMEQPYKSNLSQETIGLSGTILKQLDREGE